MSKIETVVNNELVVDVSTRTVSNGTKTIWEVLTKDGTKWATFNTALGNQAMALKGQYADLKVAIEQKDNFTNYYLNKIRPSSTATPVEQAAAKAQAAQPAEGVSYDQYKSLDGEKEKARTESIHRQVAAKVAGQISTDGSDFWPNVDALFVYFQTGITPYAKPQETSVTSHTDPGPEPDRPAPAGWDEPPLPEDDIPF